MPDLPSLVTGDAGSGSSQPKSAGLPLYWICTCITIWPFSLANRMRSPACTTGFATSGGAKQPHACARLGIITAAGASTPSTATTVVATLLDQDLPKLLVVIKSPPKFDSLSSR